MGLTGDLFLWLLGSWQEGTRPASLSSSFGDSQSGQSSRTSSSCCSCVRMWSLWLGTCSLSWPLARIHVSTCPGTSSPACPVQTSFSPPHHDQGPSEYLDPDTFISYTGCLIQLYFLTSKDMDIFSWPQRSMNATWPSATLSTAYGHPGHPPSTAPSQVMPAHDLPHGHDPHLLHILFFFLLYNIIPDGFCVLGPWWKQFSLTSNWWVSSLALRGVIVLALYLFFFIEI